MRRLLEVRGNLRLRHRLLPGYIPTEREQKPIVSAQVRHFSRTRGNR